MRPRVVEASDPAATHDLAAGRLDVAVLERDGDAPEGSTPGVVVRPLLRDPYRVVVPVSWPARTTAEVMAGPWVAGPAGSTARAALDRLVGGRGPDVAHVCLEFPAVLALVGAGLGAALVPDLALDQLRHPDVRTHDPRAAAGGRRGGLDAGARVLTVAHREAATSRAPPPRSSSPPCAARPPNRPGRDAARACAALNLRPSRRPCPRQPEPGHAPAMTRILDLSHDITPGMYTHPGLPGPEHEPFRTREQYQQSTGTTFQVDRVCMVGNTGTYLDSPFHRYADGTDLAGVALTAVADVPLVLVDARSDRAVTADLLAAALGDEDLAGAAVLVRTDGDAGGAPRTTRPRRRSSPAGRRTGSPSADPPWSASTR